MANFQLTEGEYVKACLQMVERRRIIRVAVLFLVAFILAGTALSQRGGDWKIQGTVGIVFFGITFALGYFNTIRRLKKVYRQQDSLRYELTVALDDEELAYSWPKGHIATAWTSIRRWKETPQFFLLYQSDAFANILPKHALTVDETALIRRKVEGLKRA